MTTVLVIDDDADVLTIIKDVLSPEGFEVKTVSDPTDGLQTILDNPPDIILCDIMMPGMNGYMLLQSVRESDLPFIPFIFITAVDSWDNHRRGMNMGADDYLRKPMRANDIRETIRAVMKKRELIRATGSVPVAPAPTEYHAFLSYSRADTQAMQRLRDDLRAASLSVWVDEEGLEPGTQAWEKAVGEAIRSASCLVVILSPDAERSIWVGRELALAETLNKRIFPVLVRGTERDSIPLRLMSHQWLDARHHYHEALQKLLTALRKHLNFT
jgi:DNA-binding response OmpR family regulator